jgi:hypothetical protein
MVRTKRFLLELRLTGENCGCNARDSTSDTEAKGCREVWIRARSVDKGKGRVEASFCHHTVDGVLGLLIYRKSDDTGDSDDDQGCSSSCTFCQP